MGPSPFVKKRVLSFDPVARMSRTIAAFYRFLYAVFLSRIPETGRGLPGPEPPAPPAPRSAGKLPAGRPETGDHPRRDAAGESAHPGRDVLRSRDPRARDGPGLRRGHRQVDHDPGAAGPSAAQPRPHEHRRRAGSRELQRIPESRPRRLSRLPGLAAPSGPADRQRRRRDDRRLREARARAGPAERTVEFNISSPNTRLVYEWSRKPGELATLLREVRRATEKPLIVKLSPDFAETNEREIIPAALDAGVRIINYGNTRKVANRRLSQGEGGLSGPDIFPTTLENLRRTRRVFGRDFEIIATGGVDSARQGRDAPRRRRDGGRLLHRIRHPRADSRAADSGAAAREPLSELEKCSQLIHLSTTIHRRQNRPV